MKTMNIKGKEYVTVNERLKEFRNNFAGYSLTTEIVELGADYCTMKATVIDENGVVRATGFAREVVAKSPINKFAFVENCETSAIGRALGNFGIGIDTAVCTADELLLKLAQDEPKQKDADVVAFEKDATAQKASLTRAVKADDPSKVKGSSIPLDDRIATAKKILAENNTYEKYMALKTSTRDCFDRLLIDLQNDPDRADDATALGTLLDAVSLPPRALTDEIPY